MINTTLLMSEITKGMKSIGPKYIYKHKNKTLIEHQLAFLKKYKQDIKINLILGFGAEKIKKTLEKQKNLRIRYLYNANYENEESGGNFSIAINNFNEKKESGLLLINNGILANINWERYLKKISNNTIFFVDEKCYNFDLGFDNNGDYLFYDLPNTWVEILYLNKNTVKTLKNQEIPEIHNNMFMFEIINILKEKYFQIDSFKLPPNKIFKFNSTKDSQQLSRFL